MGTMHTPLERLPTVSVGSLRQLMTTQGWSMMTTRKELLGNMRNRPSFLLVHLFYNVNFSFFTLISM